MIFTCALGARVIRIKSTKTDHIFPIKAHASCDHERALYLDTKSHYKNEGDLANKALALALTRAMLNLPYSPDTAEDLGHAVRVAIRVAGP